MFFCKKPDRPFLKDGNPLNLHFVMFIPTIAGQGTMEQVHIVFVFVFNLYSQLNMFVNVLDKYLYVYLYIWIM